MCLFFYLSLLRYQWSCRRPWDQRDRGSLCCVWVCRKEKEWEREREMIVRSTSYLRRKLPGSGMSILPRHRDNLCGFEMKTAPLAHKQKQKSNHGPYIYTILYLPVFVLSCGNYDEVTIWKPNHDASITVSKTEKNVEKYFLFSNCSVTYGLYETMLP